MFALETKWHFALADFVYDWIRKDSRHLKVGTAVGLRSKTHLRSV